MLFGSCAMLCLFLAVYACIKDRRQIRNLWLLAAGLIICLKANGILLAAIIALSLSDWLLSLFMAKTGHVAMRKAAYIYSLLCNIGMVAWFKSTTGFTAQFMPGYDAAAGIALPLGISFYLFHSVGYMTDVYKRRMAPAGRWTDYLLYLSFFPAIFAGPVMRAGRMLPQIASGTKATEANVFAGLWLVMLGLVKKMVFADYLAQFNNQVFAAPAHYSGMENTAALAGYGMQIYFDFSGYSDIAIGVAMMLGFDIGVNFDHPYRATSLTRFWHKWHISLSTWMRDYIYIPLGGNRHGSLRTKANLLLTMIVAGVWHGFTPLFLLWGAGHGIALIVQKQAGSNGGQHTVGLHPQRHGGIRLRTACMVPAARTVVCAAIHARQVHADSKTQFHRSPAHHKNHHCHSRNATAAAIRRCRHIAVHLLRILSRRPFPNPLQHGQKAANISPPGMYAIFGQDRADPRRGWRTSRAKMAHIPGARFGGLHTLSGKTVFLCIFFYFCTAVCLCDD